MSDGQLYKSERMRRDIQQAISRNQRHRLYLSLFRGAAIVIGFAVLWAALIFGFGATVIGCNAVLKWLVEAGGK
jgi:hypothetical protein